MFHAATRLPFRLWATSALILSINFIYAAHPSFVEHLTSIQESCIPSSERSHHDAVPRIGNSNSWCPIHLANIPSSGIALDVAMPDTNLPGARCREIHIVIRVGKAFLLAVRQHLLKPRIGLKSWIFLSVRHCVVYHVSHRCRRWGDIHTCLFRIDSSITYVVR